MYLGGWTVKTNSLRTQLSRNTGVNSTLKDRSRTIPFRPSTFSLGPLASYACINPSPLEKTSSKYPANVVRNQKYNFATFLPLVFYEQFKFFFNLYFLLVALSQFIPALKIGKQYYYSSPYLRDLLSSVCRVYNHLRRPPCICSYCHNGQGSL